MKKIILAAACVIALASCSDDKKTTDASSTTPPTATTPAPGTPAPGTTQTVSTVPANGQVTTPQGQTAPNVQMQNAPADGGQAPKSGSINPPHGQPGHTCAVPVGQPIP